MGRQSDEGLNEGEDSSKKNRTEKGSDSIPDEECSWSEVHEWISFLFRCEGGFRIGFTLRVKDPSMKGNCLLSFEINSSY